MSEKPDTSSHTRSEVAELYRMLDEEKRQLAAMTAERDRLKSSAEQLRDFAAHNEGCIRQGELCSCGLREAITAFTAIGFTPGPDGWKPVITGIRELVEREAKMREALEAVNRWAKPGIERPRDSVVGWDDTVQPLIDAALSAPFTVLDLNGK